MDRIYQHYCDWNVQVEVPHQLELDVAVVEADVVATVDKVKELAVLLMLMVED